MVDFVIARYNEKIEWVNILKEKYPENIRNIYIYNKGSNNIADFSPIKLENFGREGHTYYTHIYNNYDNLAECTIFLQGNPFDHSPNLFKNLEIFFSNYESIKSKYQMIFIGEKNIRCSLNSCRFHPGIPLKEVYTKVFNKEPHNNDFLFTAGANICVFKDAIHNNTKDFYKTIIDILGYHKHPIEGFVIERLHHLIFHSPPLLIFSTNIL